MSAPFALPLSVQTSLELGTVKDVVDAGGMTILYAVDADYAAAIVQAVNSHAALVAALERLTQAASLVSDELGYRTLDRCGIPTAMNQSRAALAQVQP